MFELSPSPAIASVFAPASVAPASSSGAFAATMADLAAPSAGTATASSPIADDPSALVSTTTALPPARQAFADTGKNLPPASAAQAPGDTVDSALAWLDPKADAPADTPGDTALPPSLSNVTRQQPALTVQATLRARQSDIAEPVGEPTRTKASRPTVAVDALPIPGRPFKGSGRIAQPGKDGAEPSERKTRLVDVADDPASPPVMDIYFTAAAIIAEAASAPATALAPASTIAAPTGQKTVPVSAKSSTVELPSIHFADASPLPKPDIDRASTFELSPSALPRPASSSDALALDPPRSALLWRAPSATGTPAVRSAAVQPRAEPRVAEISSDPNAQLLPAGLRGEQLFAVTATGVSRAEASTPPAIQPAANAAAEPTVRPLSAASVTPSSVSNLIGVPQSAARAFAVQIAAAARPARSIRDDRLSASPVALAASALQPALATLATPDPVSTAAPIDTRHHDWTRALIDRIDAVQDVQSARDTRIRLVPDALGTIDVALRREGDTLHVQFSADVPATRALLAEAQPRLAELADLRGLRIGQAGVDSGAFNQGPNQGFYQGPNNGQGQRPPPAAPASPSNHIATASAEDDAGDVDHRIA